VVGSHVRGFGVELDQWLSTTLLGRLPEPVRSALLATGKPVDFPVGHRLLREGDRGDHIYLLVEGMVKVTADSSAGQGTLLGIRVAGDTVGEMAALEEGYERIATVSTCRPVQARLIHRAQFDPLMRVYPLLAVEIAKMISSRLRWANRRRVDIASHNPLTRLSRVLVDIATTYGRECGSRWELGVGLTQSEIASLAGMKKRAGEVHFAKLQSAGLIVCRYRAIVVIDMPRLRDIANGAENPH
jgi:CRP/FNR family transcriptional regulator, cyclic AMP receptor protein